jgi:UV DNA damage endonuclease
VCLFKILRFNAKHNLLFFRITSDLIPFASHPICKLKWEKHFKAQFLEIGNFIKKQNMRTSMHPDQFTLINPSDEKIFANSAREIEYHEKVLDAMELDLSAKIQIHIGGVYRNKIKSLNRFMERFKRLDYAVRQRLVVENDDRNYSIRDYLKVSAKTGIPVLFDNFHHEVNSSDESIPEAFELFTKTWKKEGGLPMFDYSSQYSGQRLGKHVEKIDLNHFRKFLKESRLYDFDVMLEIKDKETSALNAMEIASNDQRILGT